MHGQRECFWQTDRAGAYADGRLERVEREVEHVEPENAEPDGARLLAARARRVPVADSGEGAHEERRQLSRIGDNKRRP